MFGLSTGSRVRVGKGVRWPLMNLKQFTLGEGATLGSNGWFYIPLANRSAKIIIGSGSAIGNDFAISCNNNIRIGSNCLIGFRVSILDFDHVVGYNIQPVTSGITKGEPITIGDDCFIGCGAVILHGVVLGKNCIVGANSVVTKSFEDGSVVAGAPAKLLCNLFSKKV
jgi:acetyltransferase-like isoleucine patch superfamily enzyme